MSFLFKRNKGSAHKPTKPNFSKTSTTPSTSQLNHSHESNVKMSTSTVTEHRKKPTGSGSHITASPWSKLTVRGSSNVLPRYSHASHLYAEGGQEIYIFGGVASDSQPKNDLWVLNLATSQFTSLRSLGETPSPRLGHASILIGNAFIVFGGLTNHDVADRQDNSLYLLNTSSLVWQKANASGARPSGRYGHTISCLGSKICLFGGRLLDYYFNDLVCFDLNNLNTSDSRWELASVVNDPPPARAGHVAFTFSDKLYIFGGTDGANFFNDLWCYHPKQSAWSKVETFGVAPNPRAGHAASVVEGILYVFGGRASDGTFLNDLYAFRLSSKHWYKLSDLPFTPSPRSSHTLSCSGLTLVLIGGKQGKGASDSNVYMLDTSRFRLGSVPTTSGRQRNTSFFSNSTGNTNPSAFNGLLTSSRIPSYNGSKVRSTSHPSRQQYIGSSNSRFNTRHQTISTPVSGRASNDLPSPVVPTRSNSSSILQPSYNLNSHSSDRRNTNDDDQSSLNSQQLSNQAKAQGEVSPTLSFVPSSHSMEQGNGSVASANNAQSEAATRSINSISEVSEVRFPEQSSVKTVDERKSLDGRITSVTLETLVEKYSELSKQQIVEWFKSKLYEILRDSASKIDSLTEKLKVANAEKNAALCEAALEKVPLAKHNKLSDGTLSTPDKENVQSTNDAHIMQENFSLHKALEVMRETSSDLDKQLKDATASQKELIVQTSSFQKELAEERERHNAISKRLQEIESLYRDRELLVTNLEDQLVDQTVTINKFAFERDQFRERSMGFENTIKDLTRKMEATDMLNVSLHESLRSVQTENSELVTEMALLKAELVKKQAIIDANANIYDKLTADHTNYETVSADINQNLKETLDKLLNGSSDFKNNEIELLHDQIRITNAKLEKREKLINASKYIEDTLRSEIQEAAEKVSNLEFSNFNLKEENSNMQLQLMKALEQRNTGAKQLVNLRMQLSTATSELDMLKLKLRTTALALEESPDDYSDILSILRADMSPFHDLHKQCGVLIDTLNSVKRGFGIFEKKFTDYHKFLENISDKLKSEEDTSLETPIHENQSIQSDQIKEVGEVLSAIKSLSDSVMLLKNQIDDLAKEKLPLSSSDDEKVNIKEKTDFMKLLVKSGLSNPPAKEPVHDNEN